MISEKIDSSVFHHSKLNSNLLKNIKDPYKLVTGGISEILQQIFNNCSFLFPYQTKELYFKLVSFISTIDITRSMHFLRQYIVSQSGKAAVPEENKNAPKIKKQKVKIEREKLYDCSVSLIKHIDKRSLLEIEFNGEVGTGLGPTLEFFNCIAESLRNRNQKGHIWRKEMPENALFPAPV